VIRLPDIPLLSFEPTRLKELSDQWLSDKIEPSLRFVLIIAALLYHEQGARRCRLLRLLGSPEEDVTYPHRAGIAADLSIVELMDGRITDKRKVYSDRYPRVEWVTRRLNALFPYGDGGKRTATYYPRELRIEVPVGGFKKRTQALALWTDYGVSGPPKLPPRKRKKKRGRPERTFQ
jgi:hypothetical protein